MLSKPPPPPVRSGFVSSATDGLSQGTSSRLLTLGPAESDDSRDNLNSSCLNLCLCVGVVVTGLFFLGTMSLRGSEAEVFRAEIQYYGPGSGEG